jgi:hypothetical protein
MAMMNETLYPVFLHQIMDRDFIRIQYYTRFSSYWDTTVIIVSGFGMNVRGIVV